MFIDEIAYRALDNNGEPHAVALDTIDDILKFMVFLEDPLVALFSPVPLAFNLSFGYQIF